MNDIVYILGNGSRWGDGEIRYSLRSVDKFLPHGKLVVVGERPAWLTNIKHVRKLEETGDPLQNSLDKIEAAVYSREVSDPFVLMNDDFFFLKPTAEIEVFHRGPLKETIENHLSKAGYYYKALQQTLALLQDIGIEDPLDYEVHYPVLLEKEKVLNALAVFPGGLLLRTLYGNLFKTGGTLRSDWKFSSSEIMDAVVKRFDPDLISTSDHIVVGTSFQKWISAHFPNLSPYESDSGEGVRRWRRDNDTGPRWSSEQQFSWQGRRYNPGDIIRGEIPAAVVKANGLRNLNAVS